MLSFCSCVELVACLCGLEVDIVGAPMLEFDAPPLVGDDDVAPPPLVCFVLVPAVTEEDVQATLLQFTVNTIATPIKNITKAQEVYVCGGGANNNYLMNRLGDALPEYEVATTSKLGIDPDWVEAIAFAWMASETISGRRIDTTAFTGAKSPVILGGIYQAGE